MRTHFRHIFCLICIILFNEAIGQDPAHYYFDADQGLPSSEVYDVEIDNKGNLWFATDRGISQYNGFRFENYDIKDGLTGNTVFEIIRSKEDKLYFTCYNGTAFQYSNNKLEALPFNDKILELNLSAWIKQINIDDHDNFLIQLTTYEHEKFNNLYYTYNPKTKELKQDPPDLKREYAVLGTGDNKFIYSKTYDVYSNTYIELGPDEYIIGLDKTQMNLSNKSKGKWPKLNSPILLVKDGKVIKTVTIQAFIRRMFKDSSGNFWICTNSGLLSIDKYLNLNEEQAILKHLDISSIIEDSENSIWITTINKGVIKVPSLYINQYRNNQIADARIINLKTYQDKIFLSSYNGNIQFFDRNLKLDTVVTDDDYLNLLQEDSLGLYSHDNGFIKKINNEYHLIQNNTNFGIVSPFLRVEENKFLLGKNTLRSYAPRNRMVNNNNDLKLSSKLIYDFKERLTILDYGKSQNSLFVGTFKGLYYSDDYSSQEFTRLHPKVLDCRITDIIPFVEGYLISTIGKGIFYLNDNFELNHITKESQYPLQNINCIYALDQYTILIGTNKGMFKLDLERSNNDLRLKDVSNYTLNNGLSSNSINSIEEFNGYIWIASEKGINYFKPKEFFKSVEAPRIFIDSISSNIKSNNLASNSYSAETTELNFHLSSFSSKKSENYPFIRYRIDEENSDTSWLYTNEDFIPTYGLGSGNHKIYIQSRNDLFNWSRPLIYSFSIEPYFYESVYFKLLIFLLAISLSILLYRLYMTYELRTKERELKLKRVELKGKKAELDALRGQMNPHFIYNALNSIQNFIFNGDEEKASSYMSKISRLMRSSLEMSKLELISIEQEINFLKNYLDLEKMRFENKFDYNIDSSYQLLSCKIPPLLIQPLVENTIKHGFTKMENKKGQLYISFRNSGDKLIVTIEDNGVGLNASIKASNNKFHKSLSTTIIRERLDIINKSNKINTCKIIIENKLEKDSIKGVIAQLFLPLNTSYA